MTEPVDRVQPENELEEALLDGAPARVLEALGEAHVLVRVEGARGGLALGTIDVEGETLVAAFTSLARLADFDPAGGDYVSVPARALAAVGPTDLRLVLNPGGALGAVLDASDRAALDSAPAPSEHWVLVAEPAREPGALLDAIRELAAREPAIREAHRGLLLRRGAAAPELVLAFDLDDGADGPALMNAAADAARTAGLESLALLVLGEDEISRLLVERRNPFFTRTPGALDPEPRSPLRHAAGPGAASP